MNTTAWQEEAKKEHDRAFMVASYLTPEQQLRLDIYKATGAHPFDVSLMNEHGEALRNAINEACQFILTGEVGACESGVTSSAIKRYGLQFEQRVSKLQSESHDPLS
jgi:predicted urease superfamily metal-dependent hydrolase